jgi:hypothetical protein
MVVDEIRRYLEAATGKLSPKRAQQLAKSLAKGQGKDQVAKAAHDLMEWSNRNRERLADLVRTEVRSQLKTVGVASRDEVDALRRRVRALETAQGARPETAAKRPSAAKRATPAKRAASAAGPATS